MKKLFGIVIPLLTTLTITTAFAEKITHSAIMSPGCSQDEIKKIAGDALKHISDKKEWEHIKGYNIKLDEDKMKMGDLTLKMNQKGCFQEKKK